MKIWQHVPASLLLAHAYRLQPVISRRQDNESSRIVEALYLSNNPTTNNHQQLASYPLTLANVRNHNVTSQIQNQEISPIAEEDPTSMRLPTLFLITLSLRM